MENSTNGTTPNSPHDPSPFGAPVPYIDPRTTCDRSEDLMIACRATPRMLLLVLDLMGVAAVVDVVGRSINVNVNAMSAMRRNHMTSVVRRSDVCW